MQFQYRLNLTLTALRRWFIAQCYDSLFVGAMWLGALIWLKVPWAPLWAVLAVFLQFIPQFGPLLTLLGPALAMLFSGASLERWLWMLGCYAAIAAIDGVVLQPFLMRRQNRVPFWATLLAPVVLGIVLPFWGVLLAPPLLAVIYAHRNAPKKQPMPPGQQFSSNGEGIVLPPESRPEGPTRRV